MSKRISQQQLESYLWGAAVLLRGTIDAGDYKQFIFPLLFYKRLCDVFDEETDAALAESGGDLEFASYPENHRFQIPREAHWNYTRQSSGNVGMAIQSAMRSIEKANPETLYGIFGDAQWTNKERLPDAMLRDLIEHFSTLDLSIANLPEDELGQGYEYLIKKFADDSGHTAAEFYTNRTVVHLMTEMLEPQPGESVYDPTCGSGGMLLSCIAHLHRQGQEWRNVRLYGQERNLMTSSIARMNCFLHGIEDFQIVRGDTLSDPKFVEGDRLKRFDLVLANPPYSIKQWDRDAFASDPWGRNLFGTPPQGRADYAFWQHILSSLASRTGRCAILFPHGVLFRQEESEMRQKLIDSDLIECILGLGPNLFYNSPMEACVVICRRNKQRDHKNRILFINASAEVTRERTQSFLTEEHIARIVAAYKSFSNEPGFAAATTLQDVRRQGGNLNIPLYVSSGSENRREAPNASLPGSLGNWAVACTAYRSALSSFSRKDCHSDEPAESGSAGHYSPEWLDRREWTTQPFGAIAENINTRVEPIDAANEVYVGLDDIDQRDLHLRRHGKGSDVIGTKLRFQHGDVIFARRRAYQRKLIVADRSGICSAHSMVLRAKTSAMLPEFLPFFMLSDRFMSRAVEISVGSLSPTINWTELKIQRFAVPPIEQQRRMLQVLQAVDDHLEALRLLNLRVEQQLTAHITSAMHAHVFPVNGNPASNLGNLFDERKESGFGHLPVLAVTIAGAVVPRESLERSVIDKTGTDKYLHVCPGDIVYNTMRMWQGSCGVVNEEGIVSPAYTVLVPRKDEADPEFWNYAFHTPELLDWFRRFSTGVAADRWRLYFHSFSRIPARIPTLSLQRDLADSFRRVEDAAQKTQAAIDATWDLLQTSVDRFCTEERTAG